VTVDSVPERCQTPAPEPHDSTHVVSESTHSSDAGRRKKTKKRQKENTTTDNDASVDAGTDTEPRRTSPAADDNVQDSNAAVEHCTTDADLHTVDQVDLHTKDLDIQSQPAAADQFNVTSDDRTMPAVESSRSPHDSTHTVSESARSSDTGKKKKKKKRHKESMANNDGSLDVGQTPVKEQSRHKCSKHKHKETNKDVKGKEETCKTENIGSEVSDKNSANDMSISDYETKHRKSARSKNSADDVSVSDYETKRKEISHSKNAADDIVSDYETQHKKSSRNKNSADDKSLSDYETKHKRSSRSRNFADDMSVSNYETKRKKSSHGKNSADDRSLSDYETKDRKSARGAKRRDVTDDKENTERAENSGRMESSERTEAFERIETSERASDRRTKSYETSAFMSLEDRIRLETSNSAAKKLVRQYRHEDGIRERTFDRVNANRKKREQKSVSF